MSRKKFKPASRTAKITYAIREVTQYARKFKQETGAEILHLNIGDPAKYDFEIPEHIREAFCRAINEGYNFYAPSAGLDELRDAIIKREKRDNNISIAPDDILVTNGTAEAIMAILAAAFSPGDEILVPSPCYPPYISAAAFYDTIAIEYRTIEEEEWIPDIDDLRRKISDKTKAIILINPNNPTGAVYDSKIVKEIIDIAGEYELFVISDEIYDKILFEGNKAPNAASLANDVPVIVFYGLSKVYLAPGWRIGYMYRWDPENKLSDLWDGIFKFLMVRISGFTPAQKAAVAALLGPQDHITKLVDKLRERRNFVFKRLNEIEGLSTALPKGAFYIFPKIEIEKYKNRDRDFVIDLLHHEHVLVVHGSGFGIYGNDHIRIVYLPPIDVLEESMNRIERFVKKVSK